MNALQKAVAKLTTKEKKLITETVEKIITHSLEGLDIEKLKGTANTFRVKKGNFRILYYLKDNNPIIIAIERRSEKTYRKF